MTEKIKTAIVCDWLTHYGGAERVIEEIYTLFPSPIYTLFYKKENFEDIKLSEAKIFTSSLQKFSFLREKDYKNFFLVVFPFFIEQFDLSDYDVIISSSHCVAKGIITKPYQLHISYVHTPMRYIWDMYFQYLEFSGLKKGLKGLIAKAIIHHLRKWDVLSSFRVDYFIANSKFVASRIKKIYRRDAEVIYPPVDVEKFLKYKRKPQDYYVVISRLVAYKRIDLIIEAFRYLKGRKLLVIGNGPEMRRLKDLAKNLKNIEFLGEVRGNKVAEYLSKAKAFVYAAEEDFGIVMAEAQAAGLPVITYSKGSAKEIIKDLETGILYNEQSPKAIRAAIRKFESIEDKFDEKKIRENAKRFAKNIFREKFKKFVEEKISKHFSN